MSADPSALIQSYISFEFYDSVGIVPTEFGNTLYFSNQEILGLVKEGEKVGTKIVESRGGFAAGSSLSLARSYSFEITSKYDQRTFGKIRRLNEAVGLEYRIKFRIHSGYLLWEEAFRTFNDYSGNAATTFDSAVVDIGGDPSYRSIGRGYGIAHSTYPVTVYEGAQLPVPSGNDIIQEYTQETRIVQVGNVGISVGFLTVTN